MQKILILIVGTMLFLSISNAQSIESKLLEITKTMSACEEDSDCLHIDLSDCPCRSGGEIGVINKKFEKEYYKKIKSIVGKDSSLCPAWYKCINQKPKCYKNKCLISSESFIEDVMREKSFEEFQEIFADFKDEIIDKGDAFLESAIRLEIPKKEAEELNREIRDYNESLWERDNLGNKTINIRSSEEKPYLSTRRSEEERLKYIKFLISRGVNPTKSLYDLILRRNVGVEAADFEIAEYFVKNTNMPKTIPYYYFDDHYSYDMENSKSYYPKRFENYEQKRQFPLKNGFTIDFIRNDDKDYLVKQWLEFDDNNKQNKLFLLAFKALPYTDPDFRSIYDIHDKQTQDCPDLTQKCGTIRIALDILNPEYQKLPKLEPADTSNVVFDKMDLKNYRSCTTDEDCTKIYFANCNGESLIFTVNKNKVNDLKKDTSLSKVIKKTAKDSKCAYAGVTKTFPLPAECIKNKCAVGGIFPSFLK